MSYFGPDGQLSKDRSVQYAKHFEKICTAAMFDSYPQIPHSAWEAALNSRSTC